MNADGSSTDCTKSTKRFKDNGPPGKVTGDNCTQENHACLTGKFAEGWNTAFGCYKKDTIAKVQTTIKNGCNSDNACKTANKDGVPKEGWTSCSTNDCNECGVSAGADDVSTDGVI